MHQWFDAQIDQKILDDLYGQPLQVLQSPRYELDYFVIKILHLFFSYLFRMSLKWFLEIMNSWSWIENMGGLLLCTLTDVF